MVSTRIPFQFTCNSCIGRNSAIGAKKCLLQEENISSLMKMLNTNLIKDKYLGDRMKKLILLFTVLFLLLYTLIPQSQYIIKTAGDTTLTTNETKNISETDDKTFLEKNSKEIPLAVLGLIFTISASFISSIITVKLSTRKFRNENWWQLKNQTYSKIIEALHHMKTFYSEMLDDELNKAGLIDSQRKTLNKKWRTGYDALSLEVDKGSFIVSKKSSEILKNDMENLKNNFDNPNLFENLSACSGIVEDCLNKIRDEAKLDLKVK